MAILLHSSQAQDRTLGVWFQEIQQGHIKLPRFQRYEAWDWKLITSFLNAVVNNLPVGITLVLEVAGNEKFVSRYIRTAELSNDSTVIQHLLDGQQRLTAFWRSMHNNYESHKYFVYLPQFDKQNPDQYHEIEINCYSRWTHSDESRRPLWADDPAKCFWRGLLPIDLLCPGDKEAQIDNWISKATCHLEPEENDPDAFRKLRQHNEIKQKLKGKITELRERVTHYNLPYLSLPSSTPKGVALQVFINMNTNSKPLNLYDIIVAEIESVAGESLHDLKQQLVYKCPKASRFSDMGDLILSTSALLQDRAPTYRGMIEMDMQVLLDNWNKLERGLRCMSKLLESQGIFDSARLPTNAVLAVIAAAYELIPEHGDFVAKGEKLLRAYLWSSFFTDRYENSAATRALADFKEIKKLLNALDYNEDGISEVPVLNREEHGLADENALMAAGWPKNTGILARGILGVASYFGANDFADGKEISYENIQTREYHHIYPKKLLEDADLNSDRALNCVLITWKTNRTIGRKDPLDYLKERVEIADENDVSNRLKSHLVSYELLSRGEYRNLKQEKLKSKLEPEFNAFLLDRAKLIYRAADRLVLGEQPTLDSIVNS